MSTSVRTSTFPRSSILVLGSNYIQSLLPATLISQIESLLESHRIAEANDLAEQQRRKLQAQLSADADEADELRYVFQRIGFQCLSETLFEDAGRNLMAGEVDPRAVVSYFPEYRGSLFGPEDSIDMFTGVADHLPEHDSVHDIIVQNLVRNYSPHLKPNTREAPPTVELKKILVSEAQTMLETLLGMWRRKRKTDGIQGLANREDVRKVVDTALGKLFALQDRRSELQSLVEEQNDVVLSEIEDTLIKSKNYSALCRLFSQRGEEAKLLNAWSRLADGVWSDPDIKDPLSSMFAFLSEKRDRALSYNWGLWFTKRDPERGLKLLMAAREGKRTGKAEEDLALLQKIRDVNPNAALQFLEYLVLQRRSSDREMHMQLASSCVDQLLACLSDEATERLWRAKASSYASSASSATTPFLTYFASTTPDSEHKRVRLKTVLFLQGSTLYNPELIRHRLVDHEKNLALETAILDGKLGQHRSALTTLVQSLRDSPSAEAYCTLGGEVINARIAQAVGESYDLHPWAALVTGANSKSSNKVGAVPLGRLKTVDAQLKKSLLRILLEVYMSSGDSAPDRTARLLNSQGMNLNVVDVISLVPPDWPVHVLSTFLARSFRRSLHCQHEGQIFKAISLGQNLEVMERTWLVLREQGAVVEEAMDDDDDSDDGEVDEKAEGLLDEKTTLQLEEHPTHDVADIDIDEAVNQHLGVHSVDGRDLDVR
ncbi:hypothetical protein JAAARDRAFT_40532 [Jaapia argillacea MUCL 33604]|uniref:Vacuolar sorting protein 39/Transforming growth factor beta receptor-associated domain-containing protein n=1 Tax=Jaapia argillacea MUCL 33604 TaxID=933084 RepID=A0A067PPC8_9AGAM|nr:hypothetical protein JAAARDRAFT_40532 [Jaapia argillacea MUCL 33604]